MPEDKDQPQTESIDYSGKQTEIDKQKQAAHQQDQERLAEEHEPA